MGSQDEYLRDFAVMLTEKGVVPISDPLQIAVYNELCDGMKRPSDISASLSIPSSSLHFVLDKMVEAGVVVKSKPEPNKKSVYYSNLAMKVFGSNAPSEEARALAEDAFADPARHYSGMSAVANMLDNYSTEVGLGLDQLKAKYAEGLADRFRDDIGSCGIETAILKIEEVFGRTTGFKFSVFSFNPLTLVFEGDMDMGPKTDMLVRFVLRCIENSTGRTYRVVSKEDFSGTDTTRFKIEFDRIEKVPEPYLNTSLHHSQSVDRFMVVELDGSVELIASDVQIEIVDAVYERPLCVTDIVNKVAAPRSTVTSNILRMVEDGVISVFYAESGAAYYGLSCSILMKRSRGVCRDNSELNAILSSTAGKENAFMEGYIMYLLSMLKGLGFDTDYMMVVLGAKYMRAAGSEGPRNFDVYFGKMSDIATNIGLSLNVVSVYPLTIGIASNDPASEMSPAMTFVKGMAHQGLEMASNGIFVRNSEDGETQRKVSFKEIYPALSMTPTEGMVIEGLATEDTAKKKRTSSVKTALLNRSVKDGGKPARTVRYITGMAMGVLLTAIIIFGFSGDNSANADVYAVSMDDSFEDFGFYDPMTMDEIQFPLNMELGSTLTFSSDADISTFGYVLDGIAYKLEPDDAGHYSVTVSSDIELEPLYLLSLGDTDGMAVSMYNFDGPVSGKQAYSFTGYIPLEDYIEVSGGLWASDSAAVCMVADPGSYISDGGFDSFLWERYITDISDAPSMVSRTLPEYTTLHLSGDYSADGRYVSGDMKINSAAGNVRLGFSSTDGPVDIVSMCSGNSSSIHLSSNSVNRTFTVGVGDGDVRIWYVPGEIS